MSFYIGCYLIQSDFIDPKHDHDSWAFPDTQGQHMSDTSNVEELLIDPEDMYNIPTQIQYGSTLWTTDEGFTPDYTYDTFYVKTQEMFYIRSWTSGSELYDQFYVRDEHFYIQAFVPGLQLYDQFYVRDEHFYIQGWTSASELYDQFYVRDEHFYIRGFTVTDWFYPIEWTVC